MTDWIDRTEALARLSIKPQTLYAYVSRGRIEVRPHPSDPRTSQYRAADVEALAQKKARGRKPRVIASSSLSWGEPSIETAISTVDRGRLIYGGLDAVALSQTASLEDVARTLWGHDAPIRLAPTASDTKPPFAALAALLPEASPVYGRGPARLARDAQDAIMALAAASGLTPGHDSVHEALAAQWALTGMGADLVRQTMVLLADHDLNASTFACRVAASTGASMAACLLAGLCALSGPVHGGASAALLRLIRASETEDAPRVIRQWLDLHGALPGFGHPLYPEGDARANALLDRIAPDHALDRLARAVMDEAGQRPNIDFALAALTRAYALPDDAPFTLFLLGRSVGWAAHAIEQAGLRKIIRPRGIYTGTMPAH